MTLNAGADTQFLHGAGGPGSDTITASGGVNEGQLRQNNDGNDPDGSKDTLNCGVRGTAYTSTFTYSGPNDFDVKNHI